MSSPILNTAEWEARTSEEGLWRAEGLEARDVFLYYRIWSPAPRVNLDTNLDVPNPEALTFLDLTGTGAVEVTINGKTFAPLDLAEGSGTVSDVALEMGGNHVLVRWRPGSEDAALHMQWRNIMRQPEVGLLFDAGGSAD